MSLGLVWFRSNRRGEMRGHKRRSAHLRRAVRGGQAFVFNTVVLDDSFSLLNDIPRGRGNSSAHTAVNSTRYLCARSYFLSSTERGSWYDLPRRVHVPLVLTLPRNAADLQALEKHVVYVARAGVRPLLAGTLGEGIHLAHGERATIIHAARKALDAAGFQDVPIIAGAGGGSTRETVALCIEVAGAGADAAIVITPGYFAGVLANHPRAVRDFYTEVAEKSPVPVLLYNCRYMLILLSRCTRRSMGTPSHIDPVASAGIDLDSDLILELASACPNLSGVKLSCVVFFKGLIPALNTDR